MMRGCRAILTPARANRLPRLSPHTMTAFQNARHSLRTSIGSPGGAFGSRGIGVEATEARSPSPWASRSPSYSPRSPTARRPRLHGPEHVDVVGTPRNRRHSARTRGQGPFAPSTEPKTGSALRIGRGGIDPPSALYRARRSESRCSVAKATRRSFLRDDQRSSP
jgi:hypothetical protein